MLITSAPDIWSHCIICGDFNPTGELVIKLRTRVLCENLSKTPFGHNVYSSCYLYSLTYAHSIEVLCLFCFCSYWMHETLLPTCCMIVSLTLEKDVFLQGQSTDPEGYGEIRPISNNNKSVPMQMATLYKCPCKHIGTSQIRYTPFEFQTQILFEFEQKPI